MKRILTAALAALALAGAQPATAQNRNTVPLYNLALGSGMAEIATAGDYAYVARGSAGIDVVKIRGIGAPSLAGNIRPYPGQANIDIDDVEVRGTILYAGNDVPNGGPTPHTGLFMYDLGTSAVAPALAGTITWGAFPAAHFGGSTHNFCVDVAAGRTYAYIASAITNAIEVFDVTIPSAPEFKDSLRPPPDNYGLTPGTVHDVAVRNGKCVSTWMSGGFAVHDVSNIAASHIDFQNEVFVSATSLLNYTRYASAETWHAAFSADGDWLITTDGRPWIGCRTWDLRTITAPNVPLVHASQFSTAATPHNLAVDGKYVYVSSFLDGLRILELLPGGLFRDAGNYDTTPTLSGAGTSAGVWGVCVAGDQILLSDIHTGLHAVDFRDTIVVTKAEWKNSNRTLTIEATSTAAPSVSIGVAGFGTMTWSQSAGKYRLVQSGVNRPASITVISDIGGTASSAVRKR